MRYSRRMKTQLAGGLIAGLALFASACSSTSTCSRGEDDVTVEPSPTMVVNGVYCSAPYGGPYQYFPGGRTLHFIHGLGAAPLPPTIWLAFDAERRAEERNPVAIAAGNLAEVVELNDSEIAIKNDTCSDFYIWLCMSTR